MDRDYYSAAFLDWFPGNIQHLNSIASVLHYPLAAQQQNNETVARAGMSARSCLQCGQTLIVTAAATCADASYAREGKTEGIVQLQVHNRESIFSR